LRWAALLDLAGMDVLAVTMVPVTPARVTAPLAATEDAFAALLSAREGGHDSRGVSSLLIVLGLHENVADQLNVGTAA
jgi:hypothetical protein